MILGDASTEQELVSLPNVFLSCYTPIPRAWSPSNQFSLFTINIGASYSLNFIQFTLLTKCSIMKYSNSSLSFSLLLLAIQAGAQSVCKGIVGGAQGFNIRLGGSELCKGGNIGGAVKVDSFSWAGVNGKQCDTAVRTAPGKASAIKDPSCGTSLYRYWSWNPF